MKPYHCLIFLLGIFANPLFAQTTDTSHRPPEIILEADTIPVVIDTLIHPEELDADSLLRITNINPYITLHVDSTLRYKLDINKDPNEYYWYLRDAPVGLKINKDDGTLTFKADKSYFLSGRLKYDTEYKVRLGVQKLANAREKVDTFFTLLFYSTEITPSRVKPTVSNTLYVDEGDTISFRVQCENGSFPIESITTLTSVTIKNYTPVTNCDDTFVWPVPFDFIKEADTEKQRVMIVSFIGTNKFFNKDTAVVKIYVRDAINYPQRLMEHQRIEKDVNFYILQLKYAFMELDKKVKKSSNTRTGFDLASGTSALGGTVFSTMPGSGEKQTGKILPSVGVALVPVKEAVSPVKNTEKNSASLIRSSIRRLEYTLTDNSLVGDRDPDILTKTKKLKDELKAAQVQLIDVPMNTGTLSEEELNRYFNSPRVNKKYKVKRGRN
jgi:hypothetical protein